MAQPSLWGHQQQQACNTIRGYWFLHHGPSARNPRLVVGNGLRPFCVDSEFGLVFYSYLSIGTLNLGSASGDPAGVLLHCLPTFALRRKGRLSVFEGFVICSPTFALRRKGRLSVLMICFRWVRANPLLLRRKVWLNPAYVVINNNKPVIL